MNLIDLLEEHDIPFKRGGEHHHVTSNWIGVDCPNCSPGTSKFKLGVNLSYLYASCWECGRLSLSHILKEITHENFHTLKELLGNLDRQKTPLEEPTGHAFARITVPLGVVPMTKQHREYVRGRGLNPGALESIWHVQGITLSRKVPWRLFIPIEMNGFTVSWTTRSISDTTVPRYINATPKEEKLNPKSLLFGEDHVTHGVIVVEGPFDVFKIGKGAVATMGVGYSQKQVARIAKYPLRVICFDNEREAQARAERLCRDLEVFQGETIKVNLSSKDPGSASDKELEKLRRLIR